MREGGRERASEEEREGGRKGGRESLNTALIQVCTGGVREKRSVRERGGKLLQLLRLVVRAGTLQMEVRAGEVARAGSIKALLRLY
jgi:hypothetical protein